MRRRITLLIACVVAALPSVFAGQSASSCLDSAGVQICYADRGRGVPVVLIHGFTGTYARHWENTGVIDALEKAGYRVVAMDCRGHGQSGKPLDPNQYGLEMVRDVVRLLDHLKIDRAHVVGYSMGGAIANHLLIDYPGRLLSATLLGAGWEGDDPQEIKSLMLELADGFARRDASALLRRVGATGAKEPTKEEIAAMNASLFARNDPDVLAAVARGLVPLFTVPGARLRAITVPVLAISGDQDPNLQSAKRMEGVVRKLELVVIPDATHASSVRPSADHIIVFLNKHRPQ
jgi:pimeloyl-ACP methyl ester carboxylesterase